MVVDGGMMSGQIISKSLQDRVNNIPDQTEDMGKFINDEIIMGRNEASGGCTNEILGPQGTGKTSLMLNYACSIMEKHPDEILIWRDSYQSSCQFNRIKNWELFAEEGTDLEIKDVSTCKLVDLPIKIFNGYDELQDMMKPQQLNVVYVRDQVIGYIKLINHFRQQPRWQSIFIDEYEDIAPLNCSGKKNRIIGLLGSEMKNIRKGLVSLFCNTQSKSQIDWRVRTTFMVETYLSGARKDQYSSVYQEAINALVKGSAWLSWEGKFGRIIYPAFKPRQPILVINDKNRISDLDIALQDE